MTEHTNPSAATRAAEKVAAGKAHESDRMPTEEESRMAEQNSLEPNVAKHEKEMAERGAHQKGEGRV